MVVVGSDDICPERYQERVLMDENNDTLLPLCLPGPVLYTNDHNNPLK